MLDGIENLVQDVLVSAVVWITTRDIRHRIAHEIGLVANYVHTADILAVLVDATQRQAQLIVAPFTTLAYYIENVHTIFDLLQNEFCDVPNGSDV